MRKLIAKCSILYHSHTYKEGDELPTDSIDNIKLWIAKGVAKWESETDTEKLEQKNDEEGKKVDGLELNEDKEEIEKEVVEQKVADKRETGGKSASKKLIDKPKLPTGRNNKK